MTFIHVSSTQPQRLSRRLQQVVPHFKQLLYNHRQAGQWLKCSFLEAVMIIVCRFKVFYPGLLNFYCPVSKSLLSVARRAREPEVVSPVDAGEGEVVSDPCLSTPELFEENPLPVSGEAVEEVKEKVTDAKPPLKVTIAKIVTDGSLSHKQVCIFTT